MSAAPLYLGFDLSTQQLKAIVVSSGLKVAAEARVDFDADLGAKYGVTKGVLVKEEEGEVYAPVAMWLEAVELLLGRLKGAASDAFSLADVRGISGSCQQHGSVFWAAGAEASLRGLRKERGLLEQMSGADVFAYEYGPNWQDHSTQAECDLFNAHLGSAEKLAEVTGSSAHHNLLTRQVKRFTGPQILRMRRKRPEVYNKTARISLASSFLASIFLGAFAPLDVGDVTGMNLWDIPNKRWSKELLELTAGGKGSVVADLGKKLGDVRQDGGGSIGPISSYFVDRFGFHPDCQIVPFTGDNPATILALPLRPLDAIVSLGTSSTFLMVTPTYKPDPSYHFMNHPAKAGHYMFMLCYKNGGLAREKVRDELVGSSASGSADPWAAFNKAVLDTAPLGVKGKGDRAKLALYFPLPEIVPNVKAGTWRYTCKADGGDLGESSSEDWSAATDARVIVESQALSMRLRSQDLVAGQKAKAGLPAQPRRIYLVGGGSLNPAIARVLGSVLGGVDGVYRLDVGGNACALGGAYKAVWGLERGGGDDGDSFDDLIGRRWNEDEAVQKVDDGFRDGLFQTYGSVLGAFAEMERRVLQVAHN